MSDAAEMKVGTVPEENVGRVGAEDSRASAGASVNANTNASASANTEGNTDGNAEGLEESDEISQMKKRLAEMEAEAAKLREMEVTGDVDSRSIFVGNVDYSASPEEIQAHFQSCGSINRVTILLDKFTGQPKGYAYVEFTEPSLVAQALVLNDSLFKGRNIKVVPKRTNIPGMSRSRGRGRGRGGYSHRGAPFLRNGYRGGYRGRARGFNPY